MSVRAVLIGVADPQPAELQLHGRAERFAPPPLTDTGALVAGWSELLDEAVPASQLYLTSLTSPARTTVAAITDALGRELDDCHDGDVLVVVMVGHGFHVEPDALPGPARSGDGVEEVFAASDGLLTRRGLRRLLEGRDTALTVLWVLDTASADLVRSYPSAREPIEFERVLGDPVSDGDPVAGGVSLICATATDAFDQAQELGGAGARGGVYSQHLRRVWGNAAADLPGARPVSYWAWLEEAATAVADRGVTPLLRYCGTEPERLDDPPFTR